MFANLLSLNPTPFGGANAAKDYDLISMGSTTSSSTRRVAATATTTPETLTISHRAQKSGSVTIDQHMLRFDSIFTDPLLGPVKLSSWMVIQVPKGTTVVTLQEIKNQVGRLIALEQTSGALDKILNGEP
jgi:hypothetical protein